MWDGSRVSRPAGRVRAHAATVPAGREGPCAVPENGERDESVQLQRPLHRRDGRVWRALPDRGRRPRPARRPRVRPRPTTRRPYAGLRLLACGGLGRGRAVAPGRAATSRATRRMSNPKREIANDTKEDEIMPDIVIATLSRNLTREGRAAAAAFGHRGGAAARGQRDAPAQRERSASSRRTISPSRCTAPRQVCAPSASAKARASWSTASSIRSNGPTRSRTSARPSSSRDASRCPAR